MIGKCPLILFVVFFLQYMPACKDAILRLTLLGWIRLPTSVFLGGESTILRGNHPVTAQLTGAGEGHQRVGTVVEMATRKIRDE